MVLTLIALLSWTCNCASSRFWNSAGIVHFLPTYSPDLNPIEEAFSKVKSEITDYRIYPITGPLRINAYLE